VGAVSAKELAGCWADGLVTGSDLVRRTGQNWIPADRMGQVDRQPADKDRPKRAAESPAESASRPLFPLVLPRFRRGSSGPSNATRGPEAEHPPWQIPIRAAVRRGRDYGLRHWRGELSLPVAFLVNGLLIVWPIALLTWLGLVLLAQASIIPFGLAYLAAFLVPLVLLVVWQIGLWRSADKFAVTGNRHWAILAKSMLGVAIAVLAYDAWTRDWAAEKPAIVEARVQEV